VGDFNRDGKLTALRADGCDVLSQLPCHTRTATMDVNDSANNSPQTVSLAGTGK